jgi:predicted nucleic acid-binding protein
MSLTFVDTVGWIALLNRSDSLHAAAVRCFQSLATSNTPLLTTSLVLAEVGNGLSRLPLRHLMSGLRQRLQQSKRIELALVDAQLFERGWLLYEQHADKEWGLVDCVSFTLMRERGVTQAVTNDHHFQQAGFMILL